MDKFGEFIFQLFAIVMLLCFGASGIALTYFVVHGVFFGG